MSQQGKQVMTQDGTGKPANPSAGGATKRTDISPNGGNHRVVGTSPPASTGIPTSPQTAPAPNMNSKNASHGGTVDTKPYPMQKGKVAPGEQTIPNNTD